MGTIKNSKNKIIQTLDDKLKTACEKIPQKKRKTVVLVSYFLLTTAFVAMLCGAFRHQNIQKMPLVKHIKTLDLPQDSLTLKFKDIFHDKKR